MEKKTLAFLTAILAVSSAFLMVPLMMAEDSEAANIGSGTEDNPYTELNMAAYDLHSIWDHYPFYVSLGTPFEIYGDVRSNGNLPMITKVTRINYSSQYETTRTDAQFCQANDNDFGVNEDVGMVTGYFSSPGNVSIILEIESSEGVESTYLNITVLDWNTEATAADELKLNVYQLDPTPYVNIGASVSVKGSSFYSDGVSLISYVTSVTSGYGLEDSDYQPNKINFRQLTGVVTKAGTITVESLIENPSTGESWTETYNIVVVGAEVIFEEQGGLTVSDQTVRPGSMINLPTVERDGYSFAGWYDAATGGSRVGGAGDSYVVSEDKTLYAHWTAIPVEITSGIPSGEKLYPLVGTTWSYTVISDPSDVEVIVTGADWLSVNGKEIIGTPTSADADTKFTVTVTVTNGVSSDSQTFSLTVKPVLSFESKPTGWIEVVPS